MSGETGCPLSAHKNETNDKVDQHFENTEILLSNNGNNVNDEKTQQAANANYFLTNKVAIITGGTSKLGKNISSKLHASGYCVALIVNSSVEEAKTMVENFNKQSFNSAFYITQNFIEANQDSADNIIKQVISKWNRIDVLVNNASIFEASKYDNSLEKQYRLLQQVNVLFPLLLVNSCIKYVEKTNGCVINICDIHSLRPLANHIGYCTSKESLVAVTKSLAKDLASKGIRANGINVGAIFFMEGKDSSEYKHDIISKIPVGRLGSPENITDTVLFLVKNDYITGQVINVDGGRTLHQ